MMEFDGEFTVEGTREELWTYFTDPEILRDAAPGIESMTLQSPGRITATIAVGVGSVKPSFDVDGVVVEADRPTRLEIRGSGEASRNSFEVTAWQEFQDNGDGTTTVVWKAEARVSGIIASMGERALNSVAERLINQFFQDIEDHVTAGTPAESRIEAATEAEIAEAGYDLSAAEPAVPEGDAGGLVGRVVGTLVRLVQGVRTTVSGGAPEPGAAGARDPASDSGGAPRDEQPPDEAGESTPAAESDNPIDRLESR